MSKTYEECSLTILVEFIFLMSFSLFCLGSSGTRIPDQRIDMEGRDEFSKPSIEHFRVAELLDKLRH